MGGLILSSIPAVFLNPMKIKFFEAKRVTETGLPPRCSDAVSGPALSWDRPLRRAAGTTVTPGLGVPGQGRHRSACVKSVPPPEFVISPKITQCWATLPGRHTQGESTKEEVVLVSDGVTDERIVCLDHPHPPVQ